MSLQQPESKAKLRTNIEGIGRSGRTCRVCPHSSMSTKRGKGKYFITSRSALTDHTPYAMAKMPVIVIAVLLAQFVGRVHHPPVGYCH